MRHGKKFNHLSRTSAHRKAMLSNMASSLIMHKRIRTTLAKAKALRGYVEPLITKSKDDSTHSRRVVFSYLQIKEAVTELFREVSVKVANRPGGYTRILKTGNRLGDNAEMCFIELVDYNENLLKEAQPKAKSTRRRRGGAKKTEETAAVEAEVVETVEATPEVEAKEEPKADAPAEKKVEEKKEDPKAKEDKKEN
jgi:large subunit ribosomal protein L17